MANNPYLEDPYKVQPNVGGWYQHAKKLSEKRGYQITMEALKRANPDIVRKRGDNIQSNDLLNVPPRPVINMPQGDPEDIIKVQLLPLNLKMAQEAIAYTKRKLPIGPSNRFDRDNEKRQSIADHCITTHVRRISSCCVDTDYYAGLIVHYALLAEEAGCGNCGEHAAVAFMYLKNKGISPLDYMFVKDPGDHVFVVIGRKEESDSSDVTTWGNHAVICDPWWGDEGMAYQATKANINDKLPFKPTDPKIPGEKLYESKYRWSSEIPAVHSPP